MNTLITLGQWLALAALALEINALVRAIGAAYECPNGYALQTTRTGELQLVPQPGKPKCSTPRPSCPRPLSTWKEIAS